MIAAATAVPIAVPIHGYHGAPALLKAAPVYKHVVAEYDAPAHYDFSYAVHDEHTGDIKNQQESRKGDVVHGSYSLIDSDGFQRTVEYTADDHNGFNAVVHREPTHIKIPVATKVLAAPVYHHAAPAVHYAPAPAVHYAAPVAKIAHYAPSVAHYAPVAHKIVAPVAHGGYGQTHVSFSGPAATYQY